MFPRRAFDTYFTFSSAIRVPQYLGGQYRLVPINSTGYECIEKPFEIDVSGDIEPGHAVQCSANWLNGTFLSNYFSTVDVWLRDGTEFTVTQEGWLTSFGLGTAPHTCKTIPLSEAPESAIEADSSQGEFGRQNWFCPIPLWPS